VKAGTFFSPAENADIRARMRAVAGRLTLPLKLGLRRTSGNVPGSGAGSSIDFQDHRPYVPGDDPRHIDWQAYARSGHYTMKLYREEVRPLADLVLDASPSMFLDETKARRTMELAWFCLESALRSGAAARLFSIQSSTVKIHEPLVGWEIGSCENSTEPPNLSRIPWRAASLRVFISDLLFPTLPQAIIPLLLAGRGRAVILVPGSPSEADPDWLGHTELLDCESPARRDLRFTADDLKNYRTVYENHFSLWRQEARRHGIPFARIPAELPFADALALEALPSAAVELL
jgi:uncharacterized protein (DUF58 family)